MYRHFLFLIALLCCAATVSSQELVTFYVKPNNSFVRVAGEVLDLSKDKTMRLQAGAYDVELWSPQFELRNIKIEVLAGEPLTVVEGLRVVSADYNDYREELSVYNTARLKRTLGEGTVGVLTGAFIATALTGRHGELDDLRGRIGLEKENYDDGVFDGAEVFRERYDIAVDKFERTEQQHNILVVGSAVLATIGAAFLFKRFTNKKRTKFTRPVYKARNPFLEETTLRHAPRLKLGTNASPIGFTFQF